jgi:hypothetical protein
MGYLQRRDGPAARGFLAVELAALSALADLGA